ncbi:hypothetical protein FACS1894164_20720 [Spirochaetia bacterium]|nr:hypothetical protein FACS1894164_20720 [Spirochaetia bacterium]
MKKNTKLAFVGLLALALTFGLTGCPEEEKTSASVTLATGSQGTAGDAKITGLTAGTKYVVKTGADWKGVVAAGTLDSGTTLTAAIAAAGSLTGTEITGLTNGTTYDVYALTDAAVDSSSGTKNIIVNVTGYSSAANVVTAGYTGTKILVYVGAAITSATVTDEVVASQAIEVGADTFTIGGTTAGGAKITATQGDLFATVSGITATTAFQITKTVTPPVPTVVTLATDSQGTAGNASITGLTATKKYVVKVDSEWREVVAAGTLGADTTLDAAIGAAVALNVGTTSITGLTNGTTYDVYEVVAAAVDSTSGTKNVIVDVTGNGYNTAANVVTAGYTGTKILVYVGGAITSATVTGVTVADQVIAVGSGTFTISNTIDDGAKITAAQSDLFATVSDITPTTTFQIANQ